jgi:hypothetical protein
MRKPRRYGAAGASSRERGEEKSMKVRLHLQDSDVTWIDTPKMGGPCAVGDVSQEEW